MGVDKKRREKKRGKRRARVWRRERERVEGGSGKEKYSKEGQDREKERDVWGREKIRWCANVVAERRSDVAIFRCPPHYG
jgi:hypothetical protein